MFLNLLMPPAREGTCTEILDSLKSKRNDLTKRYFPVDENCKVLSHVSRSDRSFLIELVTWTIFILIGLLIWLSVDILASPCWCYKCVLKLRALLSLGPRLHVEDPRRNARLLSTLHRCIPGAASATASFSQECLLWEQAFVSTAKQQNETCWHPARLLVFSLT